MRATVAFLEYKHLPVGHRGSSVCPRPCCLGRDDAGPSPLPVLLVLTLLSAALLD